MRPADSGPVAPDMERPRDHLWSRGRRPQRDM